MESEQHQYELRSRSRSRSHTPMIFNPKDSEQLEHHYDLRRRESRERSHTPSEVTSSRRSSSKSLPNSAQKLKDKTMEPISEKKEEIQAEENHDNHSHHEGSVPPITKKSERRSERQRIKRQLLTNGQGELKDNESVEITELRSKSLTPKCTVTSDYSSEEGEREDPPSRPGSAYEIYKQAGDWWNVFPKTDYTYSQASQYRYEIAPGVLAMPNMSRPSIHSDGSSIGSSRSLSQQTLSQTSYSTQEGHTDSIDGEINDTIEQNRLNEENARNMKGNSRLVYKQTHVEKYTHYRAAFYGDSASRNRFRSFSQVDSDAELDEAITLKTSNNDNRWRITKWYEKSKNLIALMFISVFQFINVKILRRNTVSSHVYQYQESKWTKMWTRLDRIFQNVYLWLINVLYLDSWLLSRASNIRENFLAHRSKILWLILLPPILLIGAYIAQKHTIASMDTLQNVQNGFTETTYRIYNDVTNLTFFYDYGFIAKYLTNFQNISLPLIPSMNVSFPSIKDIGWNITW